MSRTTGDNTSIIETNDDVSQCKLYAIERGYWSDPYLELLTGIGRHERRTPEINIGYYVRVNALRQLLERFITITHNECQILNLGCGSDSTIFYLLDRPDLHVRHFVDVDFDEVTELKAHKIRRTPILSKKLGVESDIHKIANGFHSSIYSIVPADLRDISTLENQLIRLQNIHAIDFQLPTLFLCECVLIYMSTEQSSRLLSFLTQTFSRTCLFLNFEQVNMCDRFGQIMCENFKQRSCQLVGLDACQSIQSQCQRFLNTNFSQAFCLTLKTIYEKHLNFNEKQRIESIDGGLDEKELLEQLFEHYCISWAFHDETNIGLDKVIFE